MEHNLSYLINYNKIVNDENQYLWMKCAEDNDFIINFKNEKTRDKWINTIENDLQKFGIQETFLLSLLNPFKKLHWISIKNKRDLKFQIKLPKDKFSREKKFLLNFLVKYAKISGDNDIFYLEEPYNIPK